MKIFLFQVLIDYLKDRFNENAKREYILSSESVSVFKLDDSLKKKLIIDIMFQ